MCPLKAMSYPPLYTLLERKVDCLFRTYLILGPYRKWTDGRGHPPRQLSFVHILYITDSLLKLEVHG